MNPSVSIIVRSFNDIRYIKDTMEGIFSQSYSDFEIVNVDSGSKDGTFEAVKELNPHGLVYQNPPGTYIPGKVLNDAISRCRGSIIVFNNSDCIPRSNNWLKELVTPLERDEIAAVFGNQLPRPDAMPLVRKDSERAYGDGSVSSTWFHFFSLATCAVRKELITRYPFDPDITYSEDVEWSYRMKKMGYKLHYAKDALVEHSHNYTLKEVYKRFHGEGVANARIFGLKPSVIRQFIKPFISEYARDIIYLIRHNEYNHIASGAVYRFLQKYSEYKGIRDYVLKGALR